MNFEFSAEQRELQNQINRHFSEAFPIERIMQVMDCDQAERKAIWQEFTAMGYQGMTIAEAYGGVGASYYELCLMAQEIGRFALPVPMLSSLYLATEAITLYGSEQQRHTYLPQLASGDISACFVGTNGSELRCANGLISGRHLPVADADLAQIAIVLATNEAGEAHYYVVDITQQAVTQKTVEVIDGAWPHSELRLTDAKAELLPGNGRNMREVIDRAAVLLAFEQIGGAQQCLDMAKTYALERQAFGRAIGSYQALKHKMVDIYVANEMALSHAYFAAWALANNAPELPKAAAAVRLAASKAFDEASAENIQIHGGVGFTWEYPCHIYLKRARQQALVLGSRRQWTKQLVSHIRAESEV